MGRLPQIIKYEGDNTTFVWKHHLEDFDYATQLIVHENQEAIFFKNGQALDLFGPGTYTLETGNVPMIQKFFMRNGTEGSPFHCEVYFINKTEQMSIKWGTNSKVQYTDPSYGFPISLGLSGEMSIKVADSRKFLINLVGTEKVFSRNTLTDYFRALLMTKCKSYIAKVITEKKINIFDIDSKLDEFSSALRILLRPFFDSYGIRLEQFFITTVVKPDGERQYERFKELHFRQYADVAEAKIMQQTAIIHAQTEAQKTVIESQALATKRQQEGYTYQQERGFDVAEIVGKNEAAGQFTNMGIGLGAMTGIGNSVGGIVGNSIDGAIAGLTTGFSSNIHGNYNPGTFETDNDIHSKDAPYLVCGRCGEKIMNGTHFCPKCGNKIHSPEPQKCTCPNCGKSVLQGKFCSECGYRLSSEVKCPKCGKSFSSEAKFCTDCGTRLSEN